MIAPSTIASGGEGLEARLDELVTASFGVFQLDELDRRGTDVQANQVLRLPEQHVTPTEKSKTV
jgi:hypothetical protein